MPHPTYLITTTPHEMIPTLVVSTIHHLVPAIDLSGIDALAFTSKNAVIALDSLTPQWRTIPAFVIGEATAREVEQRGGRVEFISSDRHGIGFFEELRGRLVGRSVFYPRAREIVSRLGERLQSAGIAVREAVVYENRALKLPASQKPPRGSILIFTAPSAYRHFLESFAWEASWRAIAIGKTTLEAFAPEVRAYLAPEVSLEACLKLAENLALESPL